jgi:hypothetical protein
MHVDRRLPALLVALVLGAGSIALGSASEARSPAERGGVRWPRAVPRSGHRSPGPAPVGTPPAEGRRRGPPPEAIAACADAREGDACAFDGPPGRLEGQCRVVRDGSLACVPAGHRPPPPHDED